MKLKYKCLFAVIFGLGILLCGGFSASAGKVYDCRQLRNKRVVECVKSYINTKKFKKNYNEFFNRRSVNAKETCYDTQNMVFTLFDNTNNGHILVPVVNNKRDIVGSVCIGMRLGTDNVDKNLNFLSLDTEDENGNKFELDIPSFEYYSCANPPIYQALELFKLRENKESSRLYLIEGYKGKFARLVQEDINGNKDFYLCY